MDIFRSRKRRVDHHFDDRELPGLKIGIDESCKESEVGIEVTNVRWVTTLLETVILSEERYERVGEGSSGDGKEMERRRLVQRLSGASEVTEG